MKANNKAERALAGMLRRNLAGHGAAAGKDCPEPDILAAYFERALADAEAGRWDLHFSACARCQEQLAAMARMETATTAARSEDRAVSQASWVWRWRWLAPALAATGAVALWVAMRPAPPMIESVALRTEQHVAVSPATPPATSKESGTEVIAGPAGRRRYTPPASSGPARAAAKPDAKDAREERDARSLDAFAKRAAEPAAAPRALGAAAVPPPAPAEKAQAATRQDLPVTRTDELSKMKMEAAAEDTTATPEKKGRALADTQTREGVEAKAAEQEVAAAPVAGVAAQNATGGQPAGIGLTRAGALQSRYREKQIASPSGTVAWRLAPQAVLRSSNKGKTWVIVWSEEGAVLHAGSAPSENVCWVAGERGIVLRTTDGKRFEKVNPPSSDNLIGVEARDAMNARVKTDKGETYVTADGGKTWRVE